MTRKAKPKPPPPKYKKHSKREPRKIYDERMALVKNLQDTMDAMQADPELEGVDTLAMMEEVISDALFFFTDVRRTTKGNEEATGEEEPEADDEEQAADDDANREMGLPEGFDWGNK